MNAIARHAHSRRGRLKLAGLAALALALLVGVSPAEASPIFMY